jgi:hypothetical protein
MTMTVICMACGRPSQTAYNYIRDEEQKCDGCHAIGQWRKADYQTETPPYELTVNDRRLLRSLRIAPE